MQIHEYRRMWSQTRFDNGNDHDNNKKPNDTKIDENERHGKSADDTVITDVDKEFHWYNDFKTEIEETIIFDYNDDDYNKATEEEIIFDYEDSDTSDNQCFDHHNNKSCDDNYWVAQRGTVSSQY